jgi:hypothetical protein
MPPLDFRVLEIHEKTEGQAGASQIVKTLAMCSLARRSAHFNSHHQRVLDKRVGDFEHGAKHFLA